MRPRAAISARCWFWSAVLVIPFWTVVILAIEGRL